MATKVVDDLFKYHYFSGKKTFLMICLQIGLDIKQIKFDNLKNLFTPHNNYKTFGRFSMTHLYVCIIIPNKNIYSYWSLKLLTKYVLETRILELYEEILLFKCVFFQI